MKRLNSYTQEDLQRWHMLQMAIGGYITLLDASKQLSISYRQAKRLKHAVLRNGPLGLQHGSRGRSSKRSISDDVRGRILMLARTRYAQMNDTRLTERLRAEHGIYLSRESVRRILRAAGIKNSRSDGSNYGLWPLN